MYADTHDGNDRPMHLRILSSACLVLASLAWGCGGSNVGACDYRQGSSNGPEPRCQEMRSSTPGSVESFLAACRTAGANPIEGECPREDMVAGCDEGALPDGTSAIDWYYRSPANEEGITVVESRDDVDLMCDGDVVDP